LIFSLLETAGSYLQNKRIFFAAS